MALRHAQGNKSDCCWSYTTFFCPEDVVVIHFPHFPESGSYFVVRAAPSLAVWCLWGKGATFVRWVLIHACHQQLCYLCHCSVVDGRQADRQRRRPMMPRNVSYWTLLKRQFCAAWILNEIISPFDNVRPLLLLRLPILFKTLAIWNTTAQRSTMQMKGVENTSSE